ncbi:MAG: futalosine hydrolase [Chitinophagaceae bacterium]
MKILVICATNLELQPLQNQLQTAGINMNNLVFHVSGVGILVSGFGIQQAILKHQPTFIIQAGIAGSFSKKLAIGSVVLVGKDAVADEGVVENKQWKTRWDLQLADKNNFPYNDGWLVNNFLQQYKPSFLPIVNGITVNCISTNKTTIATYKKIYHPMVESMEGASLHYNCLQYNIPFFQIRSISNYVGERNKDFWNIPLALKNLAVKTVNLIIWLNQQPPTTFNC